MSVRTIFQIAALLSSLAALPATATGQRPEREEYAVIAAILVQVFAQGDSWVVISAPTASFDCESKTLTVTVRECGAGMRDKQESLETVRADLRNHIPTASSVTIDDLMSKARTGASITEPIPTKRAYSMDDHATYSPERIGTPDYLLYFSRVGFNRDRTRALAYVAAATWVHGGLKGGRYVHLVRARHGWRIESTWLVWDMGG